MAHTTYLSLFIAKRIIIFGNGRWTKQQWNSDVHCDRKGVLCLASASLSCDAIHALSGTHSCSELEFGTASHEHVQVDFEGCIYKAHRIRKSTSPSFHNLTTIATHLSRIFTMNPHRGTHGKPVRVITNSYEVIRRPMKPYYHYDGEYSSLNIPCFLTSHFAQSASSFRGM